MSVRRPTAVGPEEDNDPNDKEEIQQRHLTKIVLAELKT